MVIGTPLLLLLLLESVVMAALVVHPVEQGW